MAGFCECGNEQVAGSCECGNEQVAGCCEYGNEHSGCRNAGNFLTSREPVTFTITTVHYEGSQYVIM